MRKIAIFEIKGGLGNQLFQYNFSKQFSNEKYIIYYNLDFYNNFSKFKDQNTHRTFQLENLNIKINKCPYVLLKLANVLNFLINSKKVSKYIPFINSHIFKYFKEKDFTNLLTDSNFSLINYFDGYWQNIEYLNNKNESIKRLFHEECKNTKKERVLIHIRRDDYLELGIELGIEYYKKAMNYMNTKIPNFSFDIFTDDEDWVVNQKVFSNRNKVFTETSEPVNLFKEMLGYTNFIIANSTLSYLAAYIAQNEDSLICYPSEWNKIKSDPKLETKKWKKIII
jgi:hypothetical protein